MSKYFQVLERLERGQSETFIARLVDSLGRRHRTEHAGPSAPAARIARPVPRPIAVPPAREGRITEGRERSSALVEPLPLSHAPTPLQGVDTLFNNIDALTLGQRPMTLVLAGASATGSVEIVTMSLAEHAQRGGEGVLVAELRAAGGHSVLMRRQPAGVSAEAETMDGSALPIDLHGGADRETVARWRQEVSPGADITLLIGPPLVDSIDSALLASLCDGLVIVAVQEETHRAALKTAAERVRLTKAPTLGVVVNAARDRTPSWLRRIMTR